jgi:hypothetical protein
MTLPLATYERRLRAALTRVRRAAPGVSCLLVAPFDLPKRARGRLMRVIEMQRALSKEFGCGFWDGYRFMGGLGSMHRWVLTKPPLASADYIHLTRRGYVYAGIALGDALMRAYDLDAHSTEPAAVGAPSAASP